MKYLDNLNLASADYYGYDAQSNQLIEECAELIQAINKHKRVLHNGQSVNMTLKESINNVSEEIADVEIMLAQIKYLLGINEQYIDTIKEMKIKRTAQRIEKELAR